MSTKHFIKYGCLFGAALFLANCRGQLSEKPPVHPQQNMYFQERYNAQEENKFFEDGRAMRDPVEGTVARGLLKEDVAYYQGLDDSGNFIAENPVELTKSFLYRGQERFEVFCSVCHGNTGDGKGIIMTGGYGYVPAPTFHQDRLREAPDGEIYSAIANGVRTMPSYATQVKVEDRWAIVAYVRALQESQNATRDDLAGYDVDIAALESDFSDKKQKEAELAEARKSSDSDSGGGNISADLGEQVFAQNGCQACHTTDGGAVIGPTFLNLYGHEVELEDGSTVVADDDYIIESIVDPNAKVVKGYFPVMPPFDYLPENELKSIVEFIKTLSDN